MTNELYFTGGKHKLLNAIAKDCLPIIITGKPNSGRTTLAQELLTLAHRDLEDDCVDLNEILQTIHKTPWGLEDSIFVSDPEQITAPIGDYYLVQCFRVNDHFTFRVQANSTNTPYPSKVTVHITAENKVVSVAGDLSFKDINISAPSYGGEADIINITSDKDVKLLNNMLSSINYMNEVSNYTSHIHVPLMPKTVYVIDYSKDISDYVNRVELQKYISLSSVYNIGLLLLNAPESIHNAVKVNNKEGEN